MSFLKALYGDAAQKGERFQRIHYLPKIDRNYSWTEIWDDMYAGRVKGHLCVRHERRRRSVPNSRKNIEALKKADFLVVGEIYPGRDEPSSGRRQASTADDMKKIQTTVYRLPGAGFRRRRTARFVNSARWLQWKNVALPTPGDARLDQDILGADLLERARSVSEGRRQVSRPNPQSCAGRTQQPQNPSLAEVAQRNQRPGARLIVTDESSTGQAIKAGQQLPGFAWLRDDGTTACGNWLYAGSWTEAGTSDGSGAGLMIRSGLGIYPNWAWSWPANRRVMYNRASCDPSGKPWDCDTSPGLVERGVGRSGLATTCPTSRSIRNRRITWARSS